MNIELFHNRNMSKSKNHFQRFFIEEGLLCWYVHSNNNKINMVRERLWDNNKDDIIFEKKIERLPDFVFNELIKQYPLLTY